MSQNIETMIADARSLPDSQRANHKHWKVRSEFAQECDSKMKSAFDADDPVFTNAAQFLDCWVTEKIVPCMEQTLRPVITLFTSELGANYAKTNAKIRDTRDKTVLKKYPKIEGKLLSNLSDHAYFIYEMINLALKTQKFVAPVVTICEQFCNFGEFTPLTDAFLQAFLTTKSPKLFVNIVQTFSILLKKYPINNFKLKQIVKVVPFLFEAAGRNNKVREEAKSICAYLITQNGKVGNILKQSVPRQWKEIKVLVAELGGGGSTDSSKQESSSSSSSSSSTQTVSTVVSEQKAKQTKIKKSSTLPAASSTNESHQLKKASSAHPKQSVNHVIQQPQPVQKQAQPLNQNISSHDVTACLRLDIMSKLSTRNIVNGAERPYETRLAAIQKVESVIQQCKPVTLSDTLIHLLVVGIKPRLEENNGIIVKAALSLFTTLGNSLGDLDTQTQKILETVDDFGLSSVFSILSRRDSHTADVAQMCLDTWKKCLEPVGMQPLFNGLSICLKNHFSAPSILDKQRLATPASSKKLYKSNIPSTGLVRMIQWFADIVSTDKCLVFYTNIKNESLVLQYQFSVEQIIKQLFAAIVVYSHSILLTLQLKRCLEPLFRIIEYPLVQAHVLTQFPVSEQTIILQHIDSLISNSETGLTGAAGAAGATRAKSINPMQHLNQFEYSRVIRSLVQIKDHQNQTPGSEYFSDKNQATHVISQLIWLVQCIIASDSGTILLDIHPDSGLVEKDYNRQVAVFYDQIGHSLNANRINQCVDILCSFLASLAPYRHQNIVVFKHVINCLFYFVTKCLDEFSQESIFAVLGTFLGVMVYSNFSQPFETSANSSIKDYDKSLFRLYNKIIVATVAKGDKTMVFRALVRCFYIEPKQFHVEPQHHNEFLRAFYNGTRKCLQKYCYSLRQNKRKAFALIENMPSRISDLRTYFSVHDYEIVQDIGG